LFLTNFSDESVTHRQLIFDKKKKDLTFLEALNDNPFNGMENPILLN